MKRCLQCNQTYVDETLKYCLLDGSQLIGIPSNIDDPTLAMHSPPPSQSVATATSQFQAPTQSPPPTIPPDFVRNGVSPFFAYLAIGLLALIAGGGIVWWSQKGSGVQIANNSVEAPNKSRETENIKTNQPSNQPSPSTTKDVSTPPSQDSSPLANEAKAALNGWVQTLTDRDFEKHMLYYADRLDIYNKKRDVDISYVRGENLKLFNKYSQFGLKIRNVNAAVTTNGQVITTFESVYDFRGDNAVHSGVDHGTEMRWKSIDGMWKIVSEK